MVRIASLVLCFLLLAGWVQAGELNLVADSSFSAGNSPWQAMGADEAGQFRGGGWDGPSCGRLWRGEQGEAFWIQEITELDPAARYRLTGYVRVEEPARAYLGLEIIGEDGTPAYRGASRQISPADGWVLLEHIFPGAEAKEVKLLAGGAFAGGMFWDAIELRRVESEAEAIARRLQALWDEHGRVYTGLIIDARGLRMQRGMSPRIYARDGREVYGTARVSADALLERGIAGYTRSLDEAVIHPLLSVSPEFPYTLGLILPALEVVGPTRSSVIISNEGADQIERWTQVYDFLGEGRVIFVID
ncbi:MAG: hypothetical protein GX182_04325 [Firmicutes bacterium]|nr:hypothetical protein [Bacillota bacterium]